MKVGIITFHASHNYGSALQAYALQQTVIDLGHECEIINFRTARQKKFYRPFFLRKGLRGVVKAFAYPKLALDDLRKYRLFEKFLNNEMILTKKSYKSNDELKNESFRFEAVISGSDQIWNTYCFDFDSSYYLDFFKEGKKIAYSPSMGPDAEKSVEDRFYPMIKDNIGKYDSISVRETGTARHLKTITGIDAKVTLDPTLLLPQKKWRELAGCDPLVKGDYIFLYTPWYDEKLYKGAIEIAEKFDLKVVCSLEDSYGFWRKHPRMNFFTAVGPREFLNLVAYSKMVVSASFHAVAFSIIYEIPFYAYGGLKDNRIYPVLHQTGLEGFCDKPDKCCLEEMSAMVKDSYSRLDEERQDSINYLIKALE